MTMHALRVLTLTNMYPTPGRPTLGTFVAEEVTALRRCGVEIDVLFVDGPRSKLNYLRGPGLLRHAVRSAAAKGAPYDLVHAHYVFCGLIALAQRTLPVVVTQHGIETQLGWTAPLSRWVTRRATATIATSPRVAAALGGPERGGRVTVIPCGVDVEMFTPMPRVEARRELGLPGDAPLVLFVGAERPEKRLPLIHAAVERLRSTLPSVQLILVHDQPRERVPIYMNACDVLVLASVAEGSPLAVREALACNLPVVATDTGDIRELVEGVRGCYLAEPDAEDIAARLLASLNLGRRSDGRNRIVQHSQEAAAHEIEALYHAVLASRPFLAHDRGAYV